MASGKIILNCLISNILEEFRTMSDFDNRRKRIMAFNKNNWWKKKGLSVVMMKFPLQYSTAFNSMVSIFNMDGTIAISHGGIEMGQGINTKVGIQTCRFLGGVASFGKDSGKFHTFSPFLSPFFPKMLAEILPWRTSVCLSVTASPPSPVHPLNLKPWRMLNSPVTQLSSGFDFFSLLSFLFHLKYDAHLLWCPCSCDICNYSFYSRQVAQVCAYELGVPLSMIRVKSTTSMMSPNNTGTGGSIGSEMVCWVSWSHPNTHALQIKQF